MIYAINYSLKKDLNGEVLGKIEKIISILKFQQTRLQNGILIINRKMVNYNNFQKFPPSFTSFSISATRSHPVARLHAAILGGSPQVEPLEQSLPNTTILAVAKQGQI